MDAIDLVLSEFEGDKMRDICSYSVEYDKEMREKIDNLREEVFDKTGDEIFKTDNFFEIHNEYVTGVANAINEMCEKLSIDKNSIDAIGFHGKTLDHYPPSIAKEKTPYTLQMGSGEMLADLTGIRVVNDFRSCFIMNGKEGAPLVGRHNENVAKIEGDGVYFNGGNTSNFAIVERGKFVFQTDVGPFNEYIDGYVRKHTTESFDKDGMYGKKGKFCKELFYKLYEIVKDFYETKSPKSGDPQYYHKEKVWEFIEKSKTDFFDGVYTLEYFSAYIAVRELIRVKKDFESIKLFGGGWKNPIVREAFENLINDKKGEILNFDNELFAEFYNNKKDVIIKESSFGENMEARLMADMARYKLEGKAWIEEVVAGVECLPVSGRFEYSDYISKASKGWKK